jgi:transcriptional regulator with XRE-family HTH domain
MVNPLTYKIRTKKLGVLIKDARLAAGKTMKDCAKIIGQSARQISNFERGEKSPSLPELEALAFYLEVPIEGFFNRETLLSSRAEKISEANMKKLVSLREKIVGARLKQARLNADIPLNEFADSVKITPHRLKSYEDGNSSIPIVELEGMLKYLGIRIEQFFDAEGIIGRWAAEQRAIQAFMELPKETRDFVTKPVNKPYIEIAKKMSGMSVEKMRAIGEGLLDITL